MENDFSLLLKAILDTSGIQGDVSKIQKVLEKYTMNLTTKLDKDSMVKSVKEVLPSILKELNNIPGVEIPMDIDWNDKLIEKSINQVIQDNQRLEKELTATAQRVSKIQFSIDNGHGVSDYQNRINSLISDFERYGVATDKAKTETQSLQQILNNMHGLSDQELVTQADKFEQEFKAVKISIEAAKQSYDKFLQPVSGEKITSLILRIQNFLSKNTSITKSARTELENYITELKGGNISLEKWNQVSNKLKETENSMRVLGKLGKTFKEQWSQAISSFSTWLSASAVVMKAVSETKEAISELKEVNTYLTEISKANDALSESELAQIGDNSFNIASKYGKTATDYLSGVQEMSRAGYENADSMAELSVAAQGAGDMTAELANQYIIATDVAFKMNGSIEALTETLDGANSITNHNAVNMTELAEGMSVVGSQAASSQMEVNEVTAAIGTMVAVTQKSGSEMGNAFKGILMNLQQVSGDVGDGEDIIDSDSLTKYEAACAELGVSLKEVKDGVISLKEPMQILKELSEEYTKLDESDAKRANLLSAVGGKYLPRYIEIYN